MRFPLIPFQLLTIVVTCYNLLFADGAFNQGAELDYLDNFGAINAAAYAAVDDPQSSAPEELLTQCKKENTVFSSNTSPPTQTVLIDANTFGTSIVSSTLVASHCDSNSICTINDEVTLEMNDNLNVGALIVRGTLKWNDETQLNESAFLCAGYVAVERSGKFFMNIQEKESGWIYIKDNKAIHPVLRARAFGGVASNSSENPLIDIQGRKLTRTWSLLSEPLTIGQSTMNLLHSPILMGWKIGDRIAIAPTKERSQGIGQDFRISDISPTSGTITLSTAAVHNYDADFYPPINVDNEAALMSAEVINLDRSIVITGDNFTHETCDPSLPESVPGEQTSVLGCRCASFRQKCTVGLHTAQMSGGIIRIQDTRVEKCGQRGVEGKYCLHFHRLRECPECLFKNNAIENSHQRGIIIHGTHLSSVEGNTLYNVRGAGVYVEDGNEMYNNISFNVVICPHKFNDPTMHGCTSPGTSNGNADASENQAGFFTRAATNNMIGNRAANSFNGMLLQAGSIGRGPSYGLVCENDARIGRMEGNVFHGHGRFGTYSLGGNYPKVTDQAVSTNGHNNDQSLCQGFDSDGNTRGLPGTFKNHLDYQNAFVGHYNAGDIQYNGHQSHDNLNLIYWKETKPFENGCSAHITQAHYSNGNMAFPDNLGSFLIEDTVFRDNVSLEPNHHCNVGTTGVLCMPQYILHNVRWENKNLGMKWVTFQKHNTQGHNANQNYGGIFSLSPSDAEIVKSGAVLEASLFPTGFVSLVSSKFSYLLSAPNNICVLSSNLGDDYGRIYDGGILCKVPLRALKIYSRGLISNLAPQLKVEVWFNDEGLPGQTASADAIQYVNFHQIGNNGQTLKQGYSFPVIPGSEQSYHVSLMAGSSSIPLDWVVEFSDALIGNRWAVEYIHLSIEGRNCGENGNGLVSSHHDRKFMWSGNTGNTFC